MLNRNVIAIGTVLFGMAGVAGAQTDPNPFNHDKFHAFCKIALVQSLATGKEDFSMIGTRIMNLSFDVPNKTVQQDDGPKNTFVIVNDSCPNNTICFHRTDQPDVAIELHQGTGSLQYTVPPNAPISSQSRYVWQCSPNVW